MKKNFYNFAITAFFALAISFTVFGCYSARTTSHGLENVAYLEIAGDSSKYSGPVKVVLDGDESKAFEASVNPSKKRAVGNKFSYKIAVGGHEVEVFYGGSMILKANIFTSANQTKIISLP